MSIYEYSSLGVLVLECLKISVNTKIRQSSHHHTTSCHTATHSVCYNNISCTTQATLYTTNVPTVVHIHHKIQYTTRATLYTTNVPTVVHIHHKIQYNSHTFLSEFCS